jgi:hypothetical protein
MKINRVMVMMRAHLSKKGGKRKEKKRKEASKNRSEGTTCPLLSSSLLSR